MDFYNYYLVKANFRQKEENIMGNVGVIGGSGVYEIDEIAAHIKKQCKEN